MVIWSKKLLYSVDCITGKYNNIFDYHVGFDWLRLWYLLLQTLS